MNKPRTPEEDRDFYAEYLAWYKAKRPIPSTDGSRALTRQEFYKNFPDTKPKRRR